MTHPDSIPDVSTPESVTPVSFDVYDGEQLVRRAVVRQANVTIGRLPKATLRLDDASVSRMHAVVEVDGPTGGSIIDLGSAAGVLVNQQPVRKAHIQSGDVLTIGRFRVVLAFGPDVGDAPHLVAPGSASEPAPIQPAAVSRISVTPDLPEIEPPPVQRIGLCVVRPGTALALCTRSTGDVRAVRTSGHVMAWPGLHTVAELDVTPFEVHAHASGEGAALTADGMRVDLTLRLTLRPRCDDAVLLSMVRTFGLPPRASQRATSVVEALTPALAASLAEVPLSGLLPSTNLAPSGESALGFDLERVEVLHVGDAVPEPTGGYRGGELDLGGVRFEGRPVSRQPDPKRPPGTHGGRVGKARSTRPPALTWAEADTSQRVILGWFVLLGGLPVAALMAAVAQTGVGWLVETTFLLAMCGLANVLAHLRSWWTAPPAILSVGACVSASNALVRPVVSDVGIRLGNTDSLTFSSISTFLLVACGVWFSVVVLFASNPKTGRRTP